MQMIFISPFKYRYCNFFSISLSLSSFTYDKIISNLIKICISYT